MKFINSLKAVFSVSVGAIVLMRSPQSLRADDFPQPTNTEKSPGSPLTPHEVARTAKLPPGFKLSVFAAEPDVQNPMSITTDERGRLWVAENYTWAGADAGVFDPKLRDRIVILEDTDGDGRHDKRTVFFDKASHLTSIQVGLGGVWALCPPQLLFIPDKNRDDIPDGPPEIVLDGFDVASVAHTVANGLKWGPDGWLYGRQGILGTSKVGVPSADDLHRITFNTSVWRYHPTRHVCEVVMHGMTNPWGFDYDEFGEIFVTNTVIGHLWHVVPGARTERMFGTDFNPHAYQLMPQVADHVHWFTGEVWNDVRKGVTDRTSAAGGGHAHTGLLIYQGNNWPPEYRGKAYTLNLHGRRINSDTFEREPVDYVAHHDEDMCFIEDPWFRGMDLINGADGGVFIADWSDTGECHEIGGVHRTSGRIYKLAYSSASPNLPTTTLANQSDVELARLQTHENDWWSRQARLLLQERAAGRTEAPADLKQELLSLFDRGQTPVVRVRAMWALYLSNCIDEEWLIAHLKDRDEHIRVWAIRFLAENHTSNDANDWSRSLLALVEVANTDPSGLALLYLASALQKMPAESRWNLATVIATRPEVSFNQDRKLSIMLWLGAEPIVAEEPQRSITLLQATTFPLLRENIARRLAFDIEHRAASVEELLSIASTKPENANSILRGIRQALDGRKNLPTPSNWSAASQQIAASGDAALRDDLNAIGVALNDPQTLASLMRVAEDSTSPSDLRNRAIQLLLLAHPTDLNQLLCKLVKDPALALEAVRGLASYEDPSAPLTILKNYPRFSPELRTAAINTLCTRKSYAHALMDALKSKQVAPSDISAFQARQIIALGEPAISEQFRSLWGDARQTPVEKRAAIDQLRSVLTPQLQQANLEKGKQTFQRTCASCHVLFGEGGKIGPDLTGSNRKNLDYILENVIDPSAVVGAQFRVSTFTLADGRVVNGIIQAQNERTLTIDTPDRRIVVDRTDIDETTPSEKSLMPDGLLQTLNEEQTRDLVGYLMSQ